MILSIKKLRLTAFHKKMKKTKSKNIVFGLLRSLQAFSCTSYFINFINFLENLDHNCKKIQSFKSNYN